MEIHKPKPVHSWRELAREIGVIVVGVAIALSGEETVRWLHQRHEVAEARKAIRFEIAQHASQALFSIEEERCRLGIFNLTMAWLDGGAQPHFRSSGLLEAKMTGAWDVSKTGALANMPFEERLAYWNFYAFVEGETEVIERDRDAAVRAGGLFNRTTELTEAEKQTLRDLTAQQRSMGQLRKLVATAMLSQAKAMGIAPPPISADSRAALNEVCADGGMPPPFPGSAG
jgi:hypothetical protein